MDVVYVVSQDLMKCSSRIPCHPGRSLLVHSLIHSLNLFSQEFSDTKRIQLVKPSIATDKDLLAYHSQDYLNCVLGLDHLSEVPQELDRDASFGLEDDCPRFPGLAEYVRLVAGATLTAANALSSGSAEVAINWEGGRFGPGPHHTQKSRASGFCYVADCVLAVLYLKRAIRSSISSSSPFPSEVASIRNDAVHRQPRVMYLDLDVHFSDGVSHAFYSSGGKSSGQVLTLSVHHASPGFFPASDLSGLPQSPPSPSSSSPSADVDAYTLSLPLHPGASDKTFASIWPLIEQVKDAFDPDCIVVQCGVDGLAGDEKCKVFNWSLGGTLSEEGHEPGEGSLGWCIERIVGSKKKGLKGWNGKKLFLGGGGYNLPNAARAWAYLTSIILENPLPLSTPIPDDTWHAGFPMYAPSFTLDVPQGRMTDRNTKEYLTDVKSRFDWVCERLRERNG